MKILLTGGTGFLGRKTVDLLVANGHEVRLLVRPTASRDRFPDNVSFVEGDITDRASLGRAMAADPPVDAVVHAAALVKILAPREDFDRINVGGLENVLEAAAEAGVGKIVYVSSFMALGPTEHGPDGQLDETASVDDRTWINDYERTKTLSDRLARRAIDDGAPLCVVYPGVIYGPGELTEGNIIVNLVLDIVRGKLPGWIGTADRRWNYVFVDDVAAGIVSVLESAAAGARYVLGGDNVTHRDFYGAIGAATGVRPPRIRIPSPVASAVGAAMKGWAKLTGGVPKLTPDLVEVNRHDWALSSARAERELGYTWRTFDQGIRETVDWLRESGQWPA